MPTTLLIVYRVLGTVLFALAAAAIVEKYRTVRGAVLLPARVLECRRASSTSSSRGAGGYRYLVELYANGRRLELETNDAFWFRHDKDKGKVLQVWYNPNARCVERKSWETEFFAAVLAVIGAALLLIREGCLPIRVPVREIRRLHLHAVRLLRIQLRRRARPHERQVHEAEPPRGEAEEQDEDGREHFPFIPSTHRALLPPPRLLLLPRRSQHRPLSAPARRATARTRCSRPLCASNA